MAQVDVTIKIKKWPVLRRRLEADNIKGNNSVYNVGIVSRKQS